MHLPSPNLIGAMFGFSWLVISLGLCARRCKTDGPRIAGLLVEVFPMMG
jgi:hypothetical protein